ncbi:Transcriptional regulator of rhamnose utilization, LacI family [Actinokineospora spheciospongiae]|uniref:Transcriptional regulator of rhamnose utilization, LacI family n=1 Tax=Actinokineospora spheciospongiae TaxID=909613 RepID=W7IFH1_9PSEU|nr:Transcriptional regulator of rhamnose utilization, LacI family [Actinokineospora spheciospongiae]
MSDRGSAGGHRQVGVKDVAAAAGVSLGTVSNVLNRPELVSARTRLRVETAMSELGFVRNESARQLRAGRSRTLAYVLLDGANPFFTDVAQGIEEVAEAEDLSVFLCNSDNRAERELSYLTRLEQQRVQGILITPADPHAAILDELPRRGTPVVIVDRTRGGDTTHCSVAVDDGLGGELALGHLVERGHERIGFVGGPLTLGQVRDRKQGAERALAAAGRPPDSLLHLETTALTVPEGRNAGQRLAGLPAATRPTAVFCANDLLALGLLQQCVTTGIRVPDDLAIVGYDDIEFAAAAAVPLTSVRQPRRKLGATAAELLLREVQDPDHVHEQVLFTPELVVRTSSQTP